MAVHDDRTKGQVVRSGLTLGALGGEHTFNGQAAALLMRHYPEFRSVVYFPTSDAVMEAALRGDVTAGCGQEQTSKDGFHRGTQARISVPGSKLYVIAEIPQRYQCSLLCKPGGTVEQVRRVLGHTGSIASSRAWLERNLPRVTIETVDTNSIGAARAVLGSDGSVASVGSPDLARELGLSEVVPQIDNGSVVNYWAVSLSPLFDPAPDRVVVTGRFRGEPPMSELVCGLRESGFNLHAVYPRATGAALYEYDYVFRFWGSGRLDQVQSLLARCPAVRLAGAWRSHEGRAADNRGSTDHSGPAH
jgi:prephenate dehydratase